jgi:hypothetical protein
MTFPERWLFDLDGCLVDSFGGTHLRPYARELVEAVGVVTGRVEIWSAGGADYAERVADRTGIGDLIDAYWDKERGVDGKWTLPFDPTGFTVVCVDDQPDGIPHGAERIAVFPYLGRNVHDAALRSILDRLTLQ